MSPPSVVGRVTRRLQTTSDHEEEAELARLLKEVRNVADLLSALGPPDQVVQGTVTTRDPSTGEFHTRLAKCLEFSRRFQTLVGHIPEVLEPPVPFSYFGKPVADRPSGAG